MASIFIPAKRPTRTTLSGLGAVRSAPTYMPTVIGKAITRGMGAAVASAKPGLATRWLPPCSRMARPNPTLHKCFEPPDWSRQCDCPNMGWSGFGATAISARRFATQLAPAQPSASVSSGGSTTTWVVAAALAVAAVGGLVYLSTRKR